MRTGTWIWTIFGSIIMIMIRIMIKIRIIDNK